MIRRGTMIIVSKVLLECQEDYVGLWSIIRALKDYETNDDEIMKKTMAIITELISKHGVVSGEFVNGVFEVWKIPLAEIIEKIQNNWIKIDRTPDIGEIVWFTKLP
jgi:hypothetical protein